MNDRQTTICDGCGNLIDDCDCDQDLGEGLPWSDDIYETSYDGDC